jgi:hypothetical protein
MRVKRLVSCRQRHGEPSLFHETALLLPRNWLPPVFAFLSVNLLAVVPEHTIHQGDKPAGALIPQAGLTVTALGKHYTPDSQRVLVRQSHADSGGSTSIRNTDRAHLEWKTNGYFQRNRDLGQVFTAPRDFQLDAIVLRTGPSDAAVLAGAPGAKLFVQFFEVIGEPRKAAGMRYGLYPATTVAFEVREIRGRTLRCSQIPLRGDEANAEPAPWAVAAASRSPDPGPVGDVSPSSGWRRGSQRGAQQSSLITVHQGGCPAPVRRRGTPPRRFREIPAD